MRKHLFLLAALGLFSCKEVATPTTTLETQQEATAITQVISAEQFAQKIINNNVQLLDVRTAQEFAEGHIPGAENYHVYDKDFAQRASQLDKNQPVYVYCKAGSRSQEAAEELEKLGFTTIYDLEGGIMAWPGEIEK